MGRGLGRGRDAGGSNRSGEAHVARPGESRSHSWKVRSVHQAAGDVAIRETRVLPVASLWVIFFPLSVCFSVDSGLFLFMFAGLRRVYGFWCVLLPDAVSEKVNLHTPILGQPFLLRFRHIGSKVLSAICL